MSHNIATRTDNGSRVDGRVGVLPTAAAALRLTLEAQAGLVTIDVCDTGTGIPPEAHRVFDRFRSASRRANRRSYGLGLALARDVISRHGGRRS